MSRAEDYLWDPRAEIDPELAELERVLQSARYVPEPLDLAAAGPRGWPGIAAWAVPLGFGLAAAAAVLAYCQPAPLPRVEPPPVSEANEVVVDPPPEAVPTRTPPVAPPPPPPESSPANERKEAAPRDPARRPTPPPPPIAEGGADPSVPPPPPSSGYGLDGDRVKLGTTDLLQGINRVKAAMKSCGQRHPVPEGTHRVPVRMTIQGSTGLVIEATTSSPFAGTALGSCVEAEAKKAEFPTFSAEIQGFTYKVSL